MDIDSFIEERCPLFGVVNARQRLNKHLSGKHDQKSHAGKRKGKAKATRSTTKPQSDEPRTYERKGITVIDRHTPKPSQLRAGMSDSEAQVLARDIFKVTIETPLGTVRTEVREVYEEGGDILVSGKILYGDTDAPIGTFERRIDVRGKSVENSYLDIESDFQGEGIGTALMAHWEDQYAHAGITRMTVTAVTSPGFYNGAYTWATYGYTVTPASAVGLFKNYLESTRPLIGDKTYYERAKELAGQYGGKPLLAAIKDMPDLREYLKGENLGGGVSRVEWKGEKVPQKIPSGKSGKVGKSSASLIEIANKWMREKSAELENDDPRFWVEIQSAIGSD